MRRQARHVLSWLCAAAGLLSCAPLLAATVTAELTPRETYVGLPATLQIRLDDVDQHDPPALPDVDGLTIRSSGPPASSSRISIINGVQSQSTTITYQFQVVPKREGRFTIPALTVKADGREFRTTAFTLLVSKAETGDLLFVEIKSDRPAVYVGESVRLTLEIWIRPYVSREYQLTLSEADMLRLLNSQATQWGIFAEALAQLQQQGRRPTGQPATRKDAQGQEHSYYLYAITQEVWPDRPGPLDAGNISIVFSYPTALRRTGDFFGRQQLEIAGQRSVIGSPKGQAVVVRDVPTDGRPAIYRGAVGSFRISAAARPVDVAVGDPITLTLNVTGSGRLESLQAPPLPEIETLTRDFKVPSDPLAGIMAGGGKQFTQSIRARNADVQQIPPIPFAYFDPRQEKFVTVYTQPIPIRVKPAAELGLSQVIDAPDARRAENRELTETAGGILANYGDVDVLAQQAFRPGPASLVALAVPPLAFVAAWLVRRRQDRFRSDHGLVRRRAARRNALARLRATDAPGDGRAGVVLEALTHYVADRVNLPAAGLTRVELIRALSKADVPGDVVRAMDDLLERCETARYAGLSATADDVTRQAVGLIERLERERLG